MSRNVVIAEMEAQRKAWACHFDDGIPYLGRDSTTRPREIPAEPPTTPDS